MFLQISFILQRANFFSVSFVLSPSFPFPKTENQKAEKKEKIEKKGTKKRKNFLQIFQLLLSFFSPKRKEFRKRRGKIPAPSHSHFPSKAGKGNEKKKKRNKKKGKRGEKEGLFIFLSISYPKKKREGKRGK